MPTPGLYKNIIRTYSAKSLIILHIHFIWVWGYPPPFYMEISTRAIFIFDARKN